MIGGPFGSVPIGSFFGEGTIPGPAAPDPTTVTPVFLLAGQDVTAFVRYNSYSLNKELNGRDTFEFQLISDSLNPQIGQTLIVILRGARYFAGTVNDVAESLLTEARFITRLINVRCTDWNEILDRRLVVRSYEHDFAGDIVQDLITDYLAAEGITGGSVDDGVRIEEFNWNHVPVSQALDDLSVAIGFYWFVDYEKKLHFLPRESAHAPFAITTDNAIIRDFSRSQSRNRYRNTQVIKGWKEITNAQTETFNGDGERRSFNVAYEVFAKPSEIRLNGNIQTVGIRGVETGKQWYYNKNETAISQDDDNLLFPNLLSTDILSVTYIGTYPGITYQQVAAAVFERQAVEGGTGIYESVETDGSLIGGTVVLAKSSGLLRKFGVLDTELTFETDVDGLDIGQLVQVELPSLNVTGEFLINTVSVEPVTSQVRRYSVQATSGEAKNAFREFWDTFLLTSQRVGVAEGEIVQYPVPLTDAGDFTEGFSATTETAHVAVVDIDAVEFSMLG
jgi:hypothetical protein